MAATDHPAAPALVAECRAVLLARFPSAAPHRIVFVTGKGGVRKSAVAAVTALQLARAGQRVLLVELGSRSFYGPWLGLTAGAQTLPWQPREGVALWDAESALREWSMGNSNALGKAQDGPVERPTTGSRRFEALGSGARAGELRCVGRVFAVHEGRLRRQPQGRSRLRQRRAVTARSVTPAAAWRMAPERLPPALLAAAVNVACKAQIVVAPPSTTFDLTPVERTTLPGRDALRQLLGPPGVGPARNGELSYRYCLMPCETGSPMVTNLKSSFDIMRSLERAEASYFRCSATVDLVSPTARVTVELH